MHIYPHTGNTRRPQLTQTNLVNIYLVDAVSTAILHEWINQTNPTGRAGVVRWPVNDTWFGSKGLSWDGQPTSFLYYWMITRSDDPISSGIPQPIFTALRECRAGMLMSFTCSLFSAQKQRWRTLSLLLWHHLRLQLLRRLQPQPPHCPRRPCRLSLPHRCHRCQQRVILRRQRQLQARDPEMSRTTAVGLLSRDGRSL